VASNKKNTYIDLFAGCGGISLGLHNAEWHGLFAIEKDKDAFQTLKHNLIDQKKHFDWPTWLPMKNHNINSILKTHKKDLANLKNKVNLVVGGPPCQGFSTAGLRKSDDKRNSLVDSYIAFIKLVEPDALFFENVFAFANTNKPNSKNEETYSEYVTRKLEKIGYNVESKFLDFSEFGVPQRRKRYILVGLKKGKSSDFFSFISKNTKDFLFSKGLVAPVSLKDALSDIERQNGEVPSVDSAGFMAGIYGPVVSPYQAMLRKDYIGSPDSHRFVKHNEEIIKKFKYFLNHADRSKSISETIRKKFDSKKRSVVLLDPKRPSATLTTLPDDYVHYSEPRILTVREYARIQSFNDWFEFKGKYTTGGKRRRLEVPRYSQIGNAIPPLFGEQVGLAFTHVLSSKNEKRNATI
jgi:DNA (cytosine-5)-methyltransferase 1